MNEFIFWDKVAQKFYDNEKSFYGEQTQRKTQKKKIISKGIS